MKKEIPTIDITDELRKLADDYIVDNQPSSFRYHLGPSVMGNECERAIWYKWRWYKDVKHEARILRLFNRGEREEAIVIKHMENAGIVFETPPDGKQFQLEPFMGHFTGSADGIISDAPYLIGRGLFECKTMNTRDFNKLHKSTVMYAKREHYVQMQLYMHGLNLEWALYIAVCKETDEWHWEVVHYDDKFAKNNMERVANIICAETPPGRISTDPSWYLCKWCDFHGICHKEEPADVNCRTCVHSMACDDGLWRCTKISNVPLRTQEQADKYDKPLDNMPCQKLFYTPIVERKAL